MTYTLRILRSAQKQLAAVPAAERQRLIDAIRRLADDSRPVGCKKLSSRPGWRIRVGDYRVLYEIEDEALIVLVVAVSHRRDAYR